MESGPFHQSGTDRAHVELDRITRLRSLRIGGYRRVVRQAGEIISGYTILKYAQGGQGSSMIVSNMADINFQVLNHPPKQLPRYSYYFF